jgi:Superfamily I DNA and RNA helicases
VAKIIPGISSSATPGERRFGQRLEALLEDDYLCWFNVPVGRRYQHPDFIVLHPRRGLLVLEVKDWKLDTIQAITRTSVSLLTLRGLVHEGNPLEQARQYAIGIKEVLERDPQLQAPAGHRFQGKLAFPYGFGVVLTEITRKQFDSTDLGEAIPEHLVICKDEMTERTDPEAFQKRLWDMFTVRFDCLLTMPQIDRIRWQLFPEIRISQKGLFDPADDSQDISGSDTLMRVMDLQQEQLARSLGEGHRVIHGVAGSGKTLILGYRCQRLAETLNKPILVLCYNVALAAKLEHMIAERGLSERVTVRHFHGWCSDQLKLYHVKKPADGPDYFDRLVAAVIEAVDKGQIPRAQYGAVLIDEGHDFAPEWLKLIVQMVDPQTNALLLLYDDAQSIYAKSRARKFSLKSVGIQAQGRTTILRVNYRNTNEILDCAFRVAEGVIRPEDAGDDGIPVVKPEMAGRHGPRPKLIRAHSIADEARQIAAQLKSFKAQGRSWRDMAVLYHANFIGDEIAAGLRQAGIPFERLEKGSSRKYKVNDDSVKLMTMYQSKGLEFPVVAIAGLGHLAYRPEQEEEDARLLYVAMTRATEALVLTASKNSVFVQKWTEWEEAA